MSAYHDRARPAAHFAALLLAGCSLSAIAMPASAQQRWDGEESSDYNNAGNWSNNTTPADNSAVVIDSTNNAPVIGAGQTGRARSLAIGEAGTGQLTIREGGDLILGDAANGGSLNIGGSQTTNATGGNGRVTVTGAGSTISAPNNLALGVGISRDATGLLEVLDGAVLTSGSGNIGTAQGSNGTVTISGAGSQWVIASGAAGIRIGSLNFADARGTLNVLDGATVTYPGGVGWTLGEGGTINVSGAGSSLGEIAITNARGAINVTDGGSANFSQLFGQFGASVRVSGANSSLTAGIFSMAQGNNATGGSLLVDAGGQLTTTGFSFAANGVPADFSVVIQGQGTRWTINQGNSRNLGAGTNQVDFRILDGAVVDSSSSVGNWSIGQGASVLVSGAGTRWLSGGVLNFNATTAGSPVGDFIIENGAQVTVSATTLSALGSLGGPVSRSLIVRSGGELSFTGGNGAGLSVRNGSVLVDGGTLNGRLELAGDPDRRTTVSVLNGGLIDGTGGGGWSADPETDFLVTGANSRLIAVGTPSVGGDVAVTAGGNASFQSIDLGSAVRANSLTVSGPDSRFTSGDFLVARFNGHNTSVLVENGAILTTGRVLAGVNGPTSVANFTVTGAGSLWQIAEGATALDFGGGTADVNLSILDGAKFESLSAINPTFSPASDVLISGAGSTMDIRGNISIGGGDPGGGTFVVENGASLITRGPSDNGLGFNGVLRTMEITNGSRWVMTGGTNAGLQIETAALLVDNSTLSAEGAVTIGQRFSGTDLILRNSDFSARALNIGSVAGNIVRIGTRADGSAGAAGVFDVGSVSLTAGNTLEINHTQSALVLASTFTGAGGINHLAGNTRFTGAQAGFSGLFAVTGGAVAIDGALGGNAARATIENASLSGTGSFGGDVTLGAARLAPGNSAGTFTIGGDLVLGAASALDFELGAPDLAPGMGSDLINVGGDLTLDGTLNITDIGGFGGGLYRLINYGGALIDNGLDFGAVPAGFEATGLMLDLATAGQVNLLAAAPAPDAFFLWDGANAAANDAVDGGSGTWTTTATNWTVPGGAANGAYTPDALLIFAAPGGTVTLDNAAGQVAISGGVQFAADGYTVTGGPLRLDTSAPMAFRIGDGSAAGAGFTATFASALTGSGGVLKTDLGRLILTGANSYTGGTAVAQGIVQGNTTSLQGAIEIGAQGALVFDQTGEGTFAGTLSGAGLIEHIAGTTILTGASTGFAGETRLSGGSMRIDGSLGNATHAMNVSGGARLSGSGTIGGNVTVGDGRIAPGNGAGQLTIGGNLALGAASVLDFELGAPGLAPGTGNDLITVGGNLTLDGTLNITDIGDFGAGLYRLINYGGALIDNGLDFGTVPPGFGATGLMLDLATAGQVNLLAAAPDLDFIFWDGGDTAGNGVIDAGSGTWSVDGTNWTTMSGADNGAFDPEDFLIFRAPAQGPSGGTITVSNTGGPVTIANGIQFAAPGFTITGDAIRLGLSGAVVRVGSGGGGGGVFDAAIDAALEGTGALTKTDLGRLILRGANTYTGGTNVAQGTLQGNATTLQGAIAIGTEGTLVFDQGAAGTFGGALTGGGLVEKRGAGVLTLSGDSGGQSGRFDVLEGALNLTGTTGALLAVAADASLTGNGTAGSLDLRGALAPGEGPAIFNLTGSATFRAGSTYQVDLAASGASDRITASGELIIEGGTVAINLLDAQTAYTNGSTFTIARGAQGRTGTFAGLTENSAFLDFALGYDSTSAIVTVSVVRLLTDIPGSFNQTEAATGLAGLVQTPGSDSLAVFNALQMLDEESARAAFDLTSGEIYADALAHTQRAALSANAVIANRSLEPGEPGWDAWIEGALGEGRIGGDGNGQTATRDSAYLTLGIDYHGEGDRWAVGLAGGWTSTDVDNRTRLSSASMDGWNIGGFVRAGDFGNGLTATASASHAEFEADVARAIRFGATERIATSSLDANATALSADLRYGFGTGPFAIGPVAGFEYARSRIDAFAETGAGSLNLASDGSSDGTTRSSVGGFASYRSDTARMLVDLRYSRGSRDDSDVALSLEGSPASFTVRPAYGERDALRIDASGEVDLGGGWSIGGVLHGRFGDQQRDMQANVKVGLRF